MTLILLLMIHVIVVFLPQCVCVVVFKPPEQQQQDFFVIFDSFAAGGTGTGNSPGNLWPFLTLLVIVSMMALIQIKSPSTTATVDEVSLPPTTTQASSTTVVSSTTNTPFVPTNCPSGYMFPTGENARRSCAMTPGAFLWNPNSETEANAVKSRFNFVDMQGSWVGGKKNSNRKFVFKIDKVGFVLNQQSIPF